MSKRVVGERQAMTSTILHLSTRAPCTSIFVSLGPVVFILVCLPSPPPLTRCLIFRPVRSENPARPPQRKPRRDRRCRCRVWLTLDLPEGALVPCLQSSCTYWRRSHPTPTFALVWSLAALGLSSRVLQSCSCLRPLPGNPVQHSMNCYSLYMLYCSVPTD